MTGIKIHLRIFPRIASSADSCVRLLISLILLTITCACSPSRKPIPPGTIPSEPTVSAAERFEGKQLRDALIGQYRQSRDPKQYRRVSRIMDRLLRAADASQEWTITLLYDDHVMNAAATKGNYIFIWTGMLRAVSADGELAAVLGHEIAHVLAKHVEPEPAEQANRAIASVAGLAVETALASQGYGGTSSSLGGALAGEAVAGAIVNPYSQELELEADHIGMFLMAEAGYNPELAVRFWERSAKETGENLSFFSTHPSSMNRLSHLKLLLPVALQRYHESLQIR